MRASPATARRFTTPEQFVRIWQGAPALAVVLAKTGLNRNVACVRACRLRKRGVPLKRFQPASGTVGPDYARLAEIAKAAAR